MTRHTSSAWIRGYQLIFSYLSDYGLNLTEEAIRCELGALEQQVEASTDEVNDIGELRMDVCQESFRDRVARYSHVGDQNPELEPLFPDPSFAAATADSENAGNLLETQTELQIKKAESATTVSPKPAARPTTGKTRLRG
jgi:hypothetical protein